MTMHAKSKEYLLVLSKILLVMCNEFNFIMINIFPIGSTIFPICVWILMHSLAMFRPLQKILLDRNLIIIVMFNKNIF